MNRQYVVNNSFMHAGSSDSNLRPVKIYSIQLLERVLGQGHTIA